MANQATENLSAQITELLAPLGYELVHLDLQTGRQNLIRVFIDRPGATIGVEDCATVSRALDEPLENSAEVNRIFQDSYELEISSPGLDRPLRRTADYERFRGSEVRVSVFRPLSADELGNADFQRKNPKQKIFVGTLKGLEGDKVLLALSSQTSRKNKQKSGSSLGTHEQVAIPFSLIAKANLEPRFEGLFDKGEEAEK